MTGGHGLQGCLQVGKGLDAIDLCGGDQGGDARPGSTALVMAGEECILAGQGDRADQVLDAVGVDLDTAIAQESLQPVPVAVDIGQFLAEARLHRYAPALRLQPFAEGGDQRRSARLAGR